MGVDATYVVSVGTVAVCESERRKVEHSHKTHRMDYFKAKSGAR